MCSGRCVLPDGLREHRACEVVTPDGGYGTGVQLTVPRLIAWPPVSLSSAQNTGRRSLVHSASGASAKPSLLRLGIDVGLAKARATTNRCVTGSIRKTFDRPFQVSSHTAHRSLVSRSNCRSITPARPVVTVAMRTNALVAWLSA